LGRGLGWGGTGRPQS